MGGGVKMFTWTKVAGNLMKCLNPLHKKKFFFTVWLMGRGCQNGHLNQSCRKFDEMPKSTKIIFSLFGWWRGWGVKMFTWTKVAGNLMKCLNPLKNFHCLANGDGFGWGGQNVHLNQSCRKFDEMPKSTKIIFFTVWLNGGVGQNVHLNQSYRKFDEMPKSTKNFFSLFGLMGGGVKMFTWTKVAGNLMKCLNPLKKFFSSLFGQWGWGAKMFTWTKVAGNLMKCLNPLKKYSFTVWPMGYRGCWKCSPEPKLQEIWWNAWIH